MGFFSSKPVKHPTNRENSLAEKTYDIIHPSSPTSRKSKTKKPA
jgi:hypothetical protein